MRSVMAPGVRRLALVAHITASVGWLGAVLAFLALAVAGLNSQDATTVRSMYVAMALLGWNVIVPFSVAALVTGLVQSLGTEWRLLRHYWIVVKLLLTIGATVLLPMHLQIASRLSTMAAERGLGFDDSRSLRVQIAGDAAAAALVLLIATILSVYKPWGKIELAGVAASRGPSWGRYVLIGFVALGLLLVVLHLAGNRLHAH